jgi:ABC-2 type transport system permease protein
MNKILLIARREFLSRVQKKTFLLTTIGLPLLIFVFYAMIIYFSVKATDNFTIAVADEANVFDGKLENKDNEIIFKFLTGETVESLNKKVTEKKLMRLFLYPKLSTLKPHKIRYKLYLAKALV